MKTLDMEGKLVKFGPAKEWFTVRFEQPLKHFNKEMLGRYAEVYELEKKNEYFGLTVEKAEWVILWGEAPKVALEITFNNPKKLDPPLNVYVRFFLEDGANVWSGSKFSDGIYLEI